MPPDAPYRDAADALYAAFAHVPRPTRVVGCPCCVPPDADRPLLARPPRDLGAQDLARYAAKALSTWGDENDFRYFAPRLLELAAGDAFAYPDTEIVFGKLGQAGWERWGQRDAVAAFLDAFWTRTLLDRPGPLPIGRALCALAAALPDVSSHLAGWARLPSEAAIRDLRDFAADELTWRGRRPGVRAGFWDTGSRPYRQVVAWLTEGAAARAVGDAFERAGDETVLELLAETDSLLRGPF
ncbi:hypothetical protein [Actinomadura opuntiae]|uniref:hypothetical protein n=1 Tax=Actinomadura sp. OS1-43 TaxID=604315 RepID=UPI00255B1094|nr:hypothetical protein [Actinomadura sp. OS1-43]MDL4818278.1 hypothetical protein [Actinomadura sp. OS1-43]